RPNNTDNGKSSIWRVHNLNVSAKSESGMQVVLTQATAEWKPIYEGGEAAWLFNPITTLPYRQESSGAIAMRGPRDKAETYEMWCLAHAFIISDANVGKNPGVSIKSFTDIPLKHYSYVFE